ncbi:adenylate cyclase type 10-like [Hyposmocoma kahamanoa]|uniref:adenylate cyclase type 10-like n=1 Tax=Hyposmocoma kahamanoa TaxID=1477025 RepID=UPI000E6D6580|nr:adenylate cyclase type 10-like [Hyposmocoma kahamanoa]
MANLEQHHSSLMTANKEMSPRERRRNQDSKRESPSGPSNWNINQINRINTIVSMVPDEIIYRHTDYSVRIYDTALMFIDVSGFTDLCEAYTKVDQGGPSRLTQVLNSYIGAMVQEILTHNGDVLNFSGDAFLSMWRKSSVVSMQDVVHTAIDCGLIIQKNYGRHLTDTGIVLKVKVAISAGTSHFAMIGDENMSHYVIVGQPVWDVKRAEYMSSAGDVLTSASVWMYVNETEYSTQSCGDGVHTKVLSIGVGWKRVDKIDYTYGPSSDTRRRIQMLSNSAYSLEGIGSNQSIDSTFNYREYSLRPAVIAALAHSTWWPELRRFMVTPVLRAVDNDEPMDFLTEIRNVVVVFLNIKTQTVTEDVLISIVDNAYKTVYNISSQAGGLVNKVSMFDKDMMFLVVFGLRGLKHEEEAQEALLCAYCLKETLVDRNIISVSIGVTSGRTYCGVVGHVLRREYTVIGQAVNKAARLMIAYPNIVTCDKETFVSSKLDLDFFRLMEYKNLKGIKKPGPVYEFNKSGLSDGCFRHPLLDRSEELRQFKRVLQNAIEHEHEQFTRYRDHKYAIALTMSPLELFALNTIFDCQFPLPENYTYTGDLLAELSVRVMVTNICKLRFSSLHIVFIRNAEFIDDESWRILIILLNAKCFFLTISINDEKMVTTTGKKCLSNSMIVNMLLSGIDRWYHAALACQLLDVQAIPADLEKVIESASGGLPGWVQNFVISLIQRLQLTVVTVSRSEAMESGAVMPSPALLTTTVFAHEDESHSYPNKRESSHDLEKIQMAVLTDANNFSNFENIMMDIEMDVIILKTYDSLSSFEKMLLKCGSVLGEIFSRKMLLHLLQSDSQIKIAKAVATLFEIRVLECEGGDFTRDTSMILIHPAPIVIPAINPPHCSCLGTRIPPSCQELPAYAFCGYMKFRHTLFRKTTYEILTENQKRELHERAVQFLERYTRRCISCGGGCFVKLFGVVIDDCTRLYHEFDSIQFVIEFQIDISENDNVYKELEFEQRYFMTVSSARDMLSGSTSSESGEGESSSAGSKRGLSFKSPIGMVPENKKVQRVRQQISALAAETRKTCGTISPRRSTPNCSTILVEKQPNVQRTKVQEKTRTRNSMNEHKMQKGVRSFSSMDVDNCECTPILLAAYSQAIDHYRAVGECEKLVETCMEYSYISQKNQNIPEAIKLLTEAEEFVSKICTNKLLCHTSWIKDLRLAQIHTDRGQCMLESCEYDEAQKHLMQALKLHHISFPTNACRIKLQDIKESNHQWMAMCMPRFYIGVEKGYRAQYFECVGRTMSTLYNLFVLRKEKMAQLAAKWSLNYQWKSNSNFRQLCMSYSQMITVYRKEHKHSKCLKLKKMAMEMCHRKKGKLDVTEVYAVVSLYTSIFQFYVGNDKNLEGLEFGLTVIPLVTNKADLATTQMLASDLLKMLLSDLRIYEMVVIMREIFFTTDHYNLSSETWYYYYAIVILLDTGHCVESYASCEKFYIRNGDAIFRSKTPEAAWNYFVCIWLVTVRLGAWERSILWEEKIRQLYTIYTKEPHEFSTMLLTRLIEGFLITLVREIDHGNMKQTIIIINAVETMFRQIKKPTRQSSLYKPRSGIHMGTADCVEEEDGRRQLDFDCLSQSETNPSEFETTRSDRFRIESKSGLSYMYYLLRAYYECIRGRNSKAKKKLNKAYDLAKQNGHNVILIWIKHIRKHWQGVLSNNLVDFWTNHIETDNLLDYTDFDPLKTQIVPYTLPLPKDFG